MNWFPVLLSLKVAAWATTAALVLGVPVAWGLARRSLPLADVVGAVVTLPLVLPPTVLGYYLLLLIGRRGVFGRFLAEELGISLIFTWQAAAIAATVVALPLVVRSAQAAMEAVDPSLVAAARTLGRSELAIFGTVILPLSWRGVAAGTVLAFARAMGEFGATLMVAGNIPGSTQTLSVAIYDAVQSGNDDLANSLVILISLLTVAALFILGRLFRVTRW